LRRRISVARGGLAGLAAHTGCGVAHRPVPSFTGPTSAGSALTHSHSIVAGGFDEMS
jgi:hypothetical protein